MAIFGKKVGRGTVFVILVDFEGKLIEVSAKNVDREWRSEARFTSRQQAKAGLDPQSYEAELTEKAMKTILNMAYEPKKKHDTSCLYDVFNKMSLDLA